MFKYFLMSNPLAKEEKTLLHSPGVTEQLSSNACLMTW